MRERDFYFILFFGQLTQKTELVFVGEPELLRDLIFVFQGIDGQYIKFDRMSNDFTIVEGISVSKPMKEMVYKLLDIGCLYLKVRDFVSDNLDKSHVGLVGQSLCAALQHELTEHYKLIAILEAQIEKQIANKISQQDQQCLTLKRLMVWTTDCYQKLRLMSVLVDVCQGNHGTEKEHFFKLTANPLVTDNKGGALITAIHNYTKHGDPFIRKYLTDMLTLVSKPFYEMLVRWVYEGELDDPYGEFLVACDPSVPEDDLWQKKYVMREDMLPSFLNKELGQKIFSIGKSLNFIRYSCHDDTLVEQYYTTFNNNETGKVNSVHG